VSKITKQEKFDAYLMIRQENLSRNQTGPLPPRVIGRILPIPLG
jgi:hypothetical protein